MKAKQQERWRETLREFIITSALFEYGFVPEYTESKFPREKRMAMLRVYEELSGTTQIVIAGEALDEMHIQYNDVVEDKDGNILVYIEDKEARD